MRVRAAAGPGPPPTTPVDLTGRDAPSARQIHVRRNLYPLPIMRLSAAPILYPEKILLEGDRNWWLCIVSLTGQGFPTLRPSDSVPTGTRAPSRSYREGGRRCQSATALKTRKAGHSTGPKPSASRRTRQPQSRIRALEMRKPLMPQRRYLWTSAQISASTVERIRRASSVTPTASPATLGMRRMHSRMSMRSSGKGGMRSGSDIRFGAIGVTQNRVSSTLRLTPCEANKPGPSEKKKTPGKMSARLTTTCASRTMTVSEGLLMFFGA